MITGRNLLWIIPALLLLSFPIWRIPIAAFLAPPSLPEERSDSAPDQVVHDFSMTGVTLLQSQNGKKTATIRAAKTYSHEKPNNYYLEEVDADLFDEEGNITNIVADKGLFANLAKQLWLADNVVITSTTEEYTMLTDELHYDGRKSQVHSPVPTVLKGNGITIKGSRLDHDMNTGRYVVGGRVFCTVEGLQDS